MKPADNSGWSVWRSPSGRLHVLPGDDRIARPGLVFVAWTCGPKRAGEALRAKIERETPVPADFRAMLATIFCAVTWGALLYLVML